MTEVSTAWREYVTSRSEEAFERVMKENVKVVYSAALRKTAGDVHLAMEITQAVFIDMARRPEMVPPDAVLAGWLYRHACFKASQTVRDTVRRRSREKVSAEVQLMNSESSDRWESVLPLLDDLMQELKESDRDALVLRFFNEADLKSVGVALNISEDAAQKRVSRALETLRGLFMRHGVTISVAGLAATLEANAAVEVPLQVMASLSGLEILTTQKAAALTTLSKTLAMKTSTAVVGGLVLAGLTGFLFKQHQQIDRLTAENVNLQRAAASNSDVSVERRNMSLAEKGSGGQGLADAEKLELMRLRDEVGRLRRERLANQPAQLGPEGGTNADTNSLQKILQVLSDRDSEKVTDTMRYQAAEKLRQIGPEALQALPTYVDLLHSETEATRYAGARALAFIAERSPEAYQEIVNGLTDASPEVRDAATHAVGLLFNYEFKNVDTATAMPILLRNLEDSSRTVRADTIQSLRQYIDRQRGTGKDAEPEVLVPLLVQRLSDDYSYTRTAAILALTEYGDKARVAVPQLRQLLNDPDEQVRRLTETALGKIEGAPADGSLTNSK